MHAAQEYLVDSQKQDVGYQKDDGQYCALGAFMIRFILVILSTTLPTASTATETTAKDWK